MSILLSSLLISDLRLSSASPPPPSDADPSPAKMAAPPSDADVMSENKSEDEPDEPLSQPEVSSQLHQQV